MKFHWTVTNEDDGQTLRSIMKNRFRMSGIMIKNVKLYGKLEVNGIHMRVIDHVKTGDQVFAEYDDDAGELRKDADIPVIYEDQYLAVVNKPSDMVTHPTHGHLDDSLLTRLSDRTLHPVMRLDRETSGLTVIAKNGFVHNAFSDTKITKLYIAAVYGIYDPAEGLIEKPIKRRPGSVMVRDVTDKDDPDGKYSVTVYKTLYADNEKNISLVAFRLITGRCHQIRVHSLSEGHPLVGDGLYGPLSVDNPDESIKNSKILDPLVGRQALHAFYLHFTHPVTGEDMEMTAGLPDDIKRLFELSDERFDELLGEGKRFLG